ncbi:DUF362 domain-containing protein [candidate division WOR-3 bacterium]|uniref:DUF362 domain-containing protein n=1 Tax=candidate division WOR-3 bacterium TaxID=2052148 RepID=A0A937XD40_UNCW3|nr:DUF362 domain-containing protein [candidate division WOR-3 bacterium]
MKEVSRRDFLKYVGVGALGLVAKPQLLSAFDRKLWPTLAASDVVQCFHDGATSGSTVNEAVVQMMVDESIMALAGVRNVGEAWKTIFPGITDASIIGIKVNCASGQCPTRPETVRCLCNGLAQMDVGGSQFKKNNIIVWERTNSELNVAGFTKYTGSDPDTVRCFGSNESGVGFDTDTTLVVASSSNQNPSKILSKMIDYEINAAVLKTHAAAKLTLTLKNHYGSVHNASGLQHTSSCSPAIPSLNQQIRDVITPNAKDKLFFIDGLFAMYSGGPSGPPNFNPKLLLMSKDPVACDKQGQNVINAERALHSLPALDAPWLPVAAEPPYSLGSLDINLIELNNVGVGESARLVTGQGLFAVSPEPVRDRATVTFTVLRPGPVSLELLDAAGRTEARLFAGTLRQGTHNVNWHTTRQLAAGTHLLRLNSGGATRVRKVLVVN